jgi:hypothetical protein
LDHEPQPLLKGKLFEQLLAAERVVNESRRHQVRQHFHVSEAREIFVHFLGKLPAGVF